MRQRLTDDATGTIIGWSAIGLVLIVANACVESQPAEPSSASHVLGEPRATSRLARASAATAASIAPPASPGAPDKDVATAASIAPPASPGAPDKDVPAPSTSAVSAPSSPDRLSEILERLAYVAGVGGTVYETQLEISGPPEEGPGCQDLRGRERKLHPHREVTWCRGDPSGATWSVVVDEESTNHLRRGTWRILRRSVGGATHYSQPAWFKSLLPHDTDVTNAPPEAPVFFDFDSDGVPEAIVVGREGIAVGMAEKRILIYTYRAGSVVRYGPARHLFAFGIADVDGDGRPDLAVNPYALTAREPQGYPGPYPRHSALEWGFVAQATPRGGFALSGSLTHQVAARICPNRPAELLPENPTQWFGYLHCARLWGAESKPLENKVRQACLSTRPADEEEKYRRWVPFDSLAEWCRHSMGLMLAIARARPPVRLP